MCALLIWALVTERLVIGKQYRATLARAIEAEKARDSAVEALIEKNVADQASTSLLGTIRREIAASRQDT